jgi:hypothetical protein
MYIMLAVRFMYVMSRKLHVQQTQYSCLKLTGRTPYHDTRNHRSFPMDDWYLQQNIDFLHIPCQV